MQRKFGFWGLGLGLVMLMTQLWLAVADNMDPTEKICAQNLSRAGLAVLMYAQDYDERLPMAYELDRPGGRWLWNEPAPVPADWRQAGSQRGSAVWVNALTPYIRARFWNLSCPATLPERLEGVDYSRRVRSPQAVSYTYNGYLHSYPLALVLNNPARVPAIWEGLGRQHLIGFALVNPALRCDRTDKLCEFTPCADPATTYPHGVVRLPRQSVWIHRSGLFMVMLDGQLVARRLGARLAPYNTNPAIDPFNRYDANGVPAAAHANACGHLPLFAPR
jgi:hypothetical protein